MPQLLTLIPFLTILLIGCFPMQSTVATAQSLRLTPATATVFHEDQLEISAPVEAVWESSGGTVNPARGRTTLYKAPAAPGRYTITAFDPADPSRRAVMVVTVLPKPQGYLNYSVAASNEFSAVIARDGTVWWWGKPAGSTTGSPVPVLLDGLRNVRSLSLNMGYMAILTEDQRLYWVSSDLKTRLQIDTTVVFAHLAETGSVLFTKSDGSLWEWRYNRYSTPQTRLQRLRINERLLQQPVAVWGFEKVLIVIDATGQLWRLWPQNFYQPLESLNSAAIKNATSPVSQAGFSLYANGFFPDVYATFVDKEGRPMRIYLGQYTTPEGWVDRYDDVNAQPLDGPGTPVRFLATRNKEILIVDRSGKVWYQAGRDKNWEQVPGLENIVQAAIGGNHYLAIRSDGTVFAWGKNNSGQLGDGTTDDTTTPVEVLGVKARVP